MCDVYSLSVDDFHAVLREFPDVRSLMENVANERLAMIRNIMDENTLEGSADDAVDSKGGHVQQEVTTTNRLTPISEQDSDYANAEDIV